MKITQIVRSLFTKVFATAAVLAAVSASAQTGAPPIFVQVPFTSLMAGGAAAACTSGFDVQGTNYQDGCSTASIKLTAGSATVYSTAADKWGNVYYATTPSAGVVQVIYAGPVLVGGVDTNPATALIEVANTGIGSNTPVAGDVYTVAGGLTTTLSGSTCANGVTALSSSGSGCQGTDSYLKKAYGVAVDADGNVFILDESNSNAYVLVANASSLGAQLATLEYANATSPQTITPTVGSIYLVAGAGGGYADGEYAISGKIHAPYGIAVDSSDNLFIADNTNDAVRMVNGPNTTAGSYGPGYIHTIAGNCTSSACTALASTPTSNTAAIGAAFVDPAGIAVDAYGNVYVGDDTNSVAGVPATVRVIYAGGSNNPLANLIDIETGVSSPTAGYVYTLAGDTVAGGSSALGNGLLATNSGVSFDRPYGLAVDKLGNIYIADYSSKGLVVELDASNGYLYDIQGGQLATLGAGDYCNGGSTGPTMTDAYGDGCPATQSTADHIYGNPSFDAQGNLYFADSGDGLIRKLIFGSFPATSVGSTSATQTLAFTLLTGSSSEVASNPTVSVLDYGLQGSGSEFVDAGGASDTCTGSAILTGYASTSASVTTSSTAAYTCTVPVTFAPSKAGLRSGAVQITTAINSSSSTYTPAYINGVGLGQALAIDPSTATSGGIAYSLSGVQGVAATTGSNGNTAYVTTTSGSLQIFLPSGVEEVDSGLSSNPHQIAVDGAGEVYVADTGNNDIALMAADSITSGIGFTSVVGSVLGTNLSAPQGVALDGAHNLYIADTGNARVLFVPASGQSQVLGSGFQAPVSVAVNASGNVYVADSGLGEIVKIPAGNGTPVVLASSIAPVSVAVDAAGNVVYIDSTLLEAIEIPVSGANSVVGSGFTAPIGVAIDSNGGVYVADSAATSLSFYSRNASAYTFADTSATAGATVTSIGNVAYSGTISSTNSTNFTLLDASTNGCASTSTLALVVGQNCGYSAQFTPSATGSLSDTTTFTNASSVNGNPTFTLSGTNAAAKVDTMTTVAVNTTTPTYGSGVQLTITVTAVSGSTSPFSAANGEVTYSVDGGTSVGPVLPNGTGSGASSSYTFTLTSLSAGQHTVSATYTPSATANFNTSSVTNVGFTVAPLALTATATPVTSNYGQAIPTISGTLSGVLSQDTGNVTAVFSTTATATSPVGTYPISVSLTGSAAANYTATVTGSPTVTINQATVTLAIANASKIYGAANPTLTGTFTGVLPADAANVTANYSTTATQNSPVISGGYPITATALSGSASGNYHLGSVTNGTLTVSPLAITATVSSVTISLGQPIPTITGTLNGVLAQDTGNVTAVYTTTATSSSPVGTYPISVSLTGSAAPNYTVTLSAPASVTITSDVVTVAVANATRAYGAANPTFTGTLTGVQPQDAANVAAIYSTTAAANSNVGSYPITATGLTGSAAANYTLGQVTNGTLTVTAAATTTTLTGASSVASGFAATFTATVASTTTGTPTGSVTFYSNGTQLGTATLTNGVATYQTSSLPAGTLSITATYAGSTNFSTSTSNTVSETVTVPVVTATTSSSSVSVSSGGSTTVTVGITAQGGYTGTATYSCALLPADMTCSFSPATATFTATSTTASTTLTISTSGTSGSSSSASLDRRSQPGSGKAPLAALAGIFAGLCMLGRSRRRLSRYIALLVLFFAGMAGIGGLTGCGGSASSSSHTPAGTYNILVEITAGTVQSVPLAVTVQ